MTEQDIRVPDQDDSAWIHISDPVPAQVEYSWKAVSLLPLVVEVRIMLK
ncbi:MULTISPECIES: hypothetical protein [Paenibacillus]|nr:MULTISPECIES: hypothetical protein [Paenibacillus]